MIQSLARRDGLEELLADYGHVIVDECHHVPVVTTERVLQAAPARYVTGLTATLRRRDGHHPIVAMQCGPVRHTIAQGTMDKHALQLRVVRRDTDFDPSALPTDASIQEVFGALADDEGRTKLIADEALELLDHGRSPIVLTERREHLEKLREHLVDRAPALVALHGEMSAVANRAAAKRLAALPKGEPCVVLATGRMSARGSTSHALTRFCSECRLHGRGPSSNTRAGFTEPSPASATRSSTTTWTPSCPCCAACSPSVSRRTGPSDTRSNRPEPSNGCVIRLGHCLSPRSPNMMEVITLGNQVIGWHLHASHDREAAG